MHPIAGMGLAYATMLALARLHPEIFGNYTDWVRLQLFVWSTCCMEHPWTGTLIWTNAAGCFYAMHGIYLLTNYCLLDELASRFYQNYFGIYGSGRCAHLLADSVVHGLPVIFAYKMRGGTPPFKYAWLVTGIPHACYTFAVLGTWDPARLYKLPPTPTNLIPLVWSCVLGGHALAQLFY
jgi:hypothetical protein